MYLAFITSIDIVHHDYTGLFEKFKLLELWDKYKKDQAIANYDSAREKKRVILSNLFLNHLSHT